MLKILLGNHYFFDIIVIVNSYPKSLVDLIKSIVKQSDLLGMGESQVILLNNSQEKKIADLCLEIVKNHHNKQSIIEVININKNQTTNEIYQKIIDLTKGEIIIFTEANCYPDYDWLDSLIKPFSDRAVSLCDRRVNIVAGRIYQVETQNIIKKICYLIDQFINKDKFEWSNIFDGQIANIALRKEFLKQQIFLNLPNINEKEISFYYRILREIEEEITYNPSAIVYKIK